MTYVLVLMEGSRVVVEEHAEFPPPRLTCKLVQAQESNLMNYFQIQMKHIY